MTGFERYLSLVDQLLAKRSNGPLSDDDEEYYATALNDCRSDMTPGEQEQISQMGFACNAAEQLRRPQ